MTKQVRGRQKKTGLSFQKSFSGQNIVFDTFSVRKLVKLFHERERSEIPLPKRIKLKHFRSMFVHIFQQWSHRNVKLFS